MYMPVLSVTPTPAELSASQTWWKHDNIVSHVLVSCLNSIVLALLPTNADDNEPVAPHTSCLVYSIFWDAFGLWRLSAGNTLYANLCALHCGSRVQNYVTKWHAGIFQLFSARYHPSFPEVITSFLDRLPALVPYQVLYCQVLKEIDMIYFNDIATFIQVTNNVLDIDNLYCPTIPT
jgi:hypothetical protein